MTSCTISLEVTDYEPKSTKTIPFNDLEFRVRCDGITEEKLKLSDHLTNHITTTLQQIHRDIKFTIRIHNIKTNNLIGICDYIIPYTLINKTQINNSFTQTKKSTVILLDATKKQFFPNTSPSQCDMWFMINANVTVTASLSKRIMKSNSTKHNKHEQKVYKRNNNINKCYGNTINANSSNSNRTSLSFRYMPLSPKLEHSNNKFKLDVDMHKQFAKIKTPSNGEVRGKRGFILDDTTSNNNNTSNIINNTNVYSSSRFSSGRKSKHTHTKCKHVLPTNRKHKALCNDNNNNTATTTTIDDVPINDCSLFVSEHYNEDTSTLNNINSCINAHYVHFQHSNVTPSTTPNNSISIPQSSDDILKYKLCTQLKSLQLYFKHHAMKIQYYTKRNSHLKQILTTAQTLYITEHQRNSNLHTQHQQLNINTFDITRLFYNYPHTTKSELKVYQHIFNKFYFEYDILHYKENANANMLNDHAKLTLLLKCVKALINSYGNVSGLVQSIPLAVRTKVKSFLVKHGIKESNEVGSGNNTMNGVNVYNNKIKAITEEDENEEEDEKGSPHKEEDVVCKEVDKVNQERKVKFKCVKGNVYKYGTQMVCVKMEKEKLKVKGSKGGFIDVDKFIALYEQSEMNVMRSSRSKNGSRVVSPIYNKGGSGSDGNGSYSKNSNSNNNNKHYSKIKYTKKKK